MSLFESKKDEFGASVFQKNPARRLCFRAVKPHVVAYFLFKLKKFGIKFVAQMGHFTPFTNSEG